MFDSILWKRALGSLKGSTVALPFDIKFELIE